MKSAANIVASAEIALESARATLMEKQDALLQHSQHALAYARVYAENDEAMTARLETITLARATRRSRTGAEVLLLSAPPQPSPRGRGRVSQDAQH